MRTPPLELPPEHKSIAASLVWMLRGNAAQRVIVAWHFGWQPAQQASGSDWAARDAGDPRALNVP